MTGKTKENIVYGFCVIVILVSLFALYFMASACIEPINLMEVVG